MGKTKSKARTKSKAKNYHGAKEMVTEKTTTFSLQNPKMEKSLTIDRKNPGIFRMTVIVKPNARTDRIYIDEGQIFVDVSSPPVKGKANIAIIHLFHKILHVPKSHIQLIKGHTSHQKMFHIRTPNLTCENIWQLILHDKE